MLLVPGFKRNELLASAVTLMELKDNILFFQGFFTCDVGDDADSGSQSWIWEGIHEGEVQAQSLLEGEEEGRCEELELEQGCQYVEAMGNPGICQRLCSHRQCSQMTAAVQLAGVADAVDVTVGASGVAGKVVVAALRNISWILHLEKTFKQLLS